MPNRTVVLSILTAALLFGAAISGCNRNRDTCAAANAPRQERRTKNRDVAYAGNRSVRPAEVLSASAYRPQRRPAARESLPYVASPVSRPQPAYYTQQYTTSGDLARVHEPLPEPVPVHEVFPNYPVAQTYQPAPYYSQPAQYYQQPTPYYPQLVQMNHPSPELAMAQANLQPLPMPVPVTQMQPVQPVVVPTVRPDQFGAPIPELEPIRYHRVANNPPPAPMPAPVPVMMSSGSNRGRQGDSREMQRALAPLPPPGGSSQEWVASPTTAMRGRGF